MTRNATKTLGEGFRIAVLTARTDLGAASNRIPSRVGPFDLRLVAHRARLPVVRMLVQHPIRRAQFVPRCMLVPLDGMALALRLRTHLAPRFSCGNSGTIAAGTSLRLRSSRHRA